VNDPSALFSRDRSGGGCQPDPAATIAALPTGGVFHGSGCYLTSGIEITKPVTVVGGTYIDPVVVNNGAKTVLPIIRIRDTSDVTIKDVVLEGTNTKGNYNSNLVNQAGLDILSSAHVNILNVRVKDTFGDGVTLFSKFGKDSNPVTDLYVDGLTVDNAGRQGITMGFVENSVLDNVTVGQAAQAGWDFESDLPHVGSGNVVINNAHDQGGIHMVEALRGPITFNNCDCQRHLHVLNDAAASGQLVTFNGGSYRLSRNSSTGDNIAGIVIQGPGRVLMNHVDITRLPGSDAPRGPAASITQGGVLALVHSPLPAPVGGPDASSAMLVQP